MSKKKSGPLVLNVVHPARLDPNVIVIMSNGMGVESQAIWERWCAEPETRPFRDWSQLIVITAQVGEEHKHDTIRLMEQRTLPMMRERGVRFVELARRGHLEEEGIVVLQDTREPTKLHPEGVYKLSDELLHSGTVPQFGGEHRCAMKFKAFVIETWLAWEFRGHTEPPVYHIFGYNAEEESRIDKSDFHIARHNDDRKIEVDGRIPLEIFGFNSEELGRIDRSAKYDGPSRTGVYPLLEWQWTRDMCVAYILEQSGLLWVKSHCSFCPFCAEASKGEAHAIKRWTEAPVETAHGLLVEYNSLCFNHRGHLYRDRALIDVIEKQNIGPVLVEFARVLESITWGVYRVRRIYTKKGKAMRCVEPITKGTRQDMLDAMKTWLHSPGAKIKTARGITYHMFEEREADVYPTRESFYVVAPGFMDVKLKGPLPMFNFRWEFVGEHGRFPTKEEEKHITGKKQKTTKTCTETSVTP